MPTGGGSPGTNIAAITGLVIGDFGHAVTAAQRATAAQNRTKLQAAFNAEHAGCFLSANDPNGNPYTATNRAVIMISGGGLTISTFDAINLANVWIKVCDHEPIPAGGYAGAIFTVKNRPAPVINLCLDGNGPWQYPTDFSRASVNQRYGYYSDGLYVLECGSSNGMPTGTINGIQGTVTVKNTRGVTGNSGPQNGVSVVECFSMVIHGCFGGDNFTFIGPPPDATFPQASQDASPCWNSGPKFHYTQLDGMGDLTPPWSKLTCNIDSQRHGPGSYAGGRVQIMPGSIVQNCGHNYNFESGSVLAIAQSKYNTAHTPPGPGVGKTRAVKIGDDTSTAYQQVWSKSGDIGFEVNGHDTGGNLVDLYGFASQGDHVVFTSVGTAPGHLNVYGAEVDSPGLAAAHGGVVYLADNATASAFHVAANGGNGSKEHLNGAQELGYIKTKTGYALSHAEVGGQVSWDTTWTGFTANTPPDVAQILTPADGATVSGHAIAWTANAHDPNDNHTVTVELRADGNSLSTPSFGVYTGPGNLFAGTFDSTVLGNGVHDLRVRVVDSGGLVLSSTKHTVTVGNDLVGPTVANLTLADGTVVSVVTGFSVDVTDASGVKDVKLRLVGENGQTFDLPLHT